MSLSDVERDAEQAAEALAGLAHRLALREPDVGDGDELSRVLADEGGAAAARVLAYLRTLRSPGDGAVSAVPTSLGPWRDWSPTRGHVWRAPRERVPRRGHGDPGE